MDFPEALCMDNVLKDYPAFEGMPKELSELDILLGMKMALQA